MFLTNVLPQTAQDVTAKLVNNKESRKLQFVFWFTALINSYDSQVSLAALWCSG